MGFVRVALADELPEGGVRIVEVENEEILLCKVQGEIYALANICTHDDGPLGDGELLGYEIECPRHGARFDVRTGDVRSLPAIVPLPRYEVRVAGGEIWVSRG